MGTWVVHIVNGWASMYGNSGTLRTAISFTHVAGLIVGGGCAIAADRGVLQALRRSPADLPSSLAGIRQAHAVVLAGLAAVLTSGALLVAADADTFLHSRFFWLKMALVALLLANGGFMRYNERRAAAGDARRTPLAFAATASLTLWMLTTLAGAALGHG